MDDAGVKKIFEKENCRMVREVPNIGVEEEKNPTVSGEKVMLWN
jgi:hypothetical protein